MWKLGLRQRNSQKGIHKWDFPCSAGLQCVKNSSMNISCLGTFSSSHMDMTVRPSTWRASYIFVFVDKTWRENKFKILNTANFDLRWYPERKLLSCLKRHLKFFFQTVNFWYALFWNVEKWVQRNSSLGSAIFKKYLLSWLLDWLSYSSKNWLFLVPMVAFSVLVQYIIGKYFSNINGFRRNLVVLLIHWIICVQNQQV